MVRIGEHDGLGAISGPPETPCLSIREPSQATTEEGEPDTEAEAVEGDAAEDDEDDDEVDEEEQQEVEEEEEELEEEEHPCSPIPGPGQSLQWSATTETAK
eukprot:RCo020843